MLPQGPLDMREGLTLPLRKVGVGFFMGSHSPKTDFLPTGGDPMGFQESRVRFGHRAVSLDPETPPGSSLPAVDPTERVGWKSR